MTAVPAVTEPLSGSLRPGLRIESGPPPAGGPAFSGSRFSGSDFWGRRLPLIVGIVAALGAIGQLDARATGNGNGSRAGRGAQQAAEPGEGLLEAVVPPAVVISRRTSTVDGQPVGPAGPVADTLTNLNARPPGATPSGEALVDSARATPAAPAGQAQPPVQLARLSPSLDGSAARHGAGDASRPSATAASADVSALGAERRERLTRYLSRAYRVPAADVSRYLSTAYEAASDYRLDPMLVVAVMAIESSFNPVARSRVGAQGLMQVHTRVHTEKFRRFGGVRRVYDPSTNVQVGAQILSMYLQRHGTPEAALKAYVGAAFMRHDGGYGRKVLGMRDKLRAVADGRGPSRREPEAAARGTAGRKVEGLQAAASAPTVAKATRAGALTKTAAARAGSERSESGRKESGRKESGRSGSGRTVSTMEPGRKASAVTASAPAAGARGAASRAQPLKVAATTRARATPVQDARVVARTSRPGQAVAPRSNRSVAQDRAGASRAHGALRDGRRVVARNDALR